MEPLANVCPGYPFLQHVGRTRINTLLMQLLLLRTVTQASHAGTESKKLKFPSYYSCRQECLQITVLSPEAVFVRGIMVTTLFQHKNHINHAQLTTT